MAKWSVAVIVGSLRAASINRRAARALEKLAPDTLAFHDIEIGGLPLYNEDLEREPPAAWAAFRQAVRACDAVLFVTPEYNRSVPGALKNAIDWAYKPFVKKAVAYLSYGSAGGARAVEHLRNIMVELQAASVRHGVHIGGADFMDVLFGRKTWDDILPIYVPFTKELFDNLRWWAAATKAAREAEKAAA